MKEQFRSWKPRAKTLEYLQHIKKIIHEYKKLRIKLTLRQLYYQLVARGIIPNKLQEYHKLSAILTNARYAGFVNWTAIEDRIRVPEKPRHYSDVAQLVRVACNSFRLDRWKGQEHYVELFTEKDALSSILAPIAYNWHVHFCVNRGYTSASAIYDLSKRCINQINKGKKVMILYIGDHDPSGLDMVRDIKERLAELVRLSFELENKNYELTVVPVALTMSQIKQYNPPPNPAKITDPRAKRYIEKFEAVSWEVDALKPEVLIDLVNNAIQSRINMNLLSEIKVKEVEDKKALETFAESLKKKEPTLSD